MQQSLPDKLRKKGWPEEDIKYAMNILRKDEDIKQRENFGKKVAPLTYWIGLVITIIGNILVAFALVPVLLAVKGFFLYAIICVFGLTFGMLFNLLITHMEQLEQKQYLIAGLFIPAIAIVTTIVMVKLSNEISTTLHITTQDPLFISIAYVTSFMLPYVFQKLIEHLSLQREFSLHN